MIVRISSSLTAAIAGRSRLMISASFRAQSGIPFNALIPHPVYGDNEGFGVPRGTAIVPDNAAC